MIASAKPNDAMKRWHVCAALACVTRHDARENGGRWVMSGPSTGNYWKRRKPVLRWQATP